MKGRKLRPGFAVWLTGLPSSGKTTLARALGRILSERGFSVQVLDSDLLRKIFTPRPTYSQEERDWFYGVIVFLAELLTANGVNVLIAATAPRRVYREEARSRIGRFAEIFVDCPPESCRDRDPKGLWRGADRGEISTLPGKGTPYEPPENPEVRVKTDDCTVEEAVHQIFIKLNRRRFLGMDAVRNNEVNPIIERDVHDLGAGKKSS